MTLTKVIFVMIIAGVSFSGFADVYVHGYRRHDGTYVQTHHRSEPNGNKNDNWSHKRNTNPYTGEEGTKE